MREKTRGIGVRYDEAMTAQDAFRSWMFSSMLIACALLAVAFGIAVLIVVLSSSRKRDE